MEKYLMSHRLGKSGFIHGECTGSLGHTLVYFRLAQPATDGQPAGTSQVTIIDLQYTEALYFLKHFK
jgi:hypothetical protein